MLSAFFAGRSSRSTHAAGPVPVPAPPPPPPAPAPARRDRAAYRRWWLLPVWTALVLSVVVTFALLRPVLATSEPPVTAGGILLFVEGARKAPAASIDATIWRTGFPDISIVELELQFEEPPLGAHWYVIASGQYEIAKSAPLPTYCVYPGGELGPDGTILCPRDELTGSVGARYRAGGLGAIDHDNRVRAIKDHEAYDDGTASVIEGRFTAAGRIGDKAAHLTISLPIRSPRLHRAGSETIGALAPIASYNQSDLGLNEDLGPVASQTARGSAYAETATRVPLSGIEVSSIGLTLREELGFKDVASSRPPVVSDDRLVWDTPETRRDGVQYVLHDPVAANRQLVQTFVAGLTASTAFAFMLLLLEPLLRRKAGLTAV